MSVDYFAVTEVTWPAFAYAQLGPWTVRDGRGGGKRVSAATADGAWTADDIAEAETAMRDLNHDPLFMLRDGEHDLDDALAVRGYRLIDPVWIYTISLAELETTALPHATAIPAWPPLAIQKEIWASGGIGPARWAVMDRVTTAKTAILARASDQPAGTAFVAVRAACAMIHAIEVLPAFRRQGAGRRMLHAAARWAKAQDCTELSLLVTKANAPANALYTSMGFRPVGSYHYRVSRPHNIVERNDQRTYCA